MLSRPGPERACSPGTKNKREISTQRLECVTDRSSSSLFQLLPLFLFFFSLSCFSITTSPSPLAVLKNPSSRLTRAILTATAQLFVLFSSVNRYCSLKSRPTPLHINNISPVCELSVSTTSSTPLFPHERYCDASLQFHPQSTPRASRPSRDSPKFPPA